MAKKIKVAVLCSFNLARVAPAVTVIHFAGRVELPNLDKLGILLHPTLDLAAHRMSYTLAALGPRPVVELHAAGLKVGEIAVQNRQSIRCLLDSEQNLPQMVSTL